ncbi:MAG: hypothetical protein ABR508_09350 [Candidatus Baltobacteraceae bacterium]
MSRRGGLAYLAVFLFALAMLFAGSLRHPVYTPDGLVYARFAARDAGRTPERATLDARAFYENTPLMQSPRYRNLVEISTAVAFERSQIFANRVLYPALAGALMPLAGFRALFVVSALSYVAFAFALLWLLVALGRSWLALLLTLAALACPLARTSSASDLTDMLALALWTLALGALLRSMVRGRSNALLAVLAIASVLLVLTRPTPYLILLPALAAALLRGMWMELAASALSLPVFAAAAAASRAFGVSEQLRWIYANEPQHARGTLAQWYRGALAATIRSALAIAVRSIAPVVAVIAAAYAVMRTALRDEAWVLIAAAAACVLSLAVNPVPSQIPRVVGLPLLPVFCALFQCAFAPPRADRRRAVRAAHAR